MTVPIIVMMITGLILIIVSFFVTESFTSKEDNYNVDLMTIDENYEFSDRELRIIKRKIEDVIANHAKDILYETNDSLASMANEKTLALGEYAVAVCEEIEKNHKEVMFLYSMLDDKQKELMNTVRVVDEINRQMKDTLSKTIHPITVTSSSNKEAAPEKEPIEEKKTSAIDQLSALAKRKREAEALAEHAAEVEAKQQVSQAAQQSKEEVIQPTPTKQTFETEEASNEVQYEDAEYEDAEYEDEEYEDMFSEDDQPDSDSEEEYEEEFEENENSNDIILAMHRGGSSIIEIAKQLGLGVGEVKLVIDLYQGE